MTVAPRRPLIDRNLIDSLRKLVMTERATYERQTINADTLIALCDMALESLTAHATAIELAAMICESVNNYDNPMTALDCADAIRALKETS